MVILSENRQPITLARLLINHHGCCEAIWYMIENGADIQAALKEKGEQVEENQPVWYSQKYNAEEPDMHLILDLAGMLPAAGAVFDGINATWYLAEGDYTNAALSGMALIPVIGEFAGAGKAGLKGLKCADDIADAVKVPDNTKDVAKAVDDMSGTAKYLDDVVESGKYSNLGNMSFEDGKKYSSWSSLRKEGLSYKQVEKIKITPKGQKPSPETYLSNDYINNHLQSFKESGAVKIMPNEPTGTIGGKGGTFVMSGDELDEIIKYADGDVSKIETILGLDQGYLGKNPVVVSIEDTSSLRIPSGNELGAWPEYWVPGGYTSGGIKEAVVNPAAEGTYTYKHLFE